MSRDKNRPLDHQSHSKSGNDEQAPASNGMDIAKKQQKDHLIKGKGWFWQMSLCPVTSTLPPTWAKVISRRALQRSPHDLALPWRLPMRWSALGKQDCIPKIAGSRSCPVVSLRCWEDLTPTMWKPPMKSNSRALTNQSLFREQVHRTEQRPHLKKTGRDWNKWVSIPRTMVLRL